MRFTIMQHAVGFRRDGSVADDLISGQEGTLMRLLILRRGRSLTREDIARHLSRPGRPAVSPDSVPAYIGRLRSRIGPDLVRSNAGGYSCGLDELEVDAFVFETRVRQYHVDDVTDIDDEDNDYGEIYEQLLELHAMWHANPAQQFEDEQDDEFLIDTYRNFQRYWDCLNRCIVYNELHSRRKPRIEKAIDRLEQLLRQERADEQLWALLFRAHASLSGHEGARMDLHERVRRQFPSRMPSELRYTIGRIDDGHDDALFAIDQRRRLPADQRRVDDLVQTIGISPASELELRRSKLEPLECISQTVSRLCVAGILGTKWVADSYVRAQFARLLGRLDDEGGSVRFLLINPQSEAYQRFSQLRWSAGDAQPLSMLHSLSADHPSFQVRLYNSLPIFRIVLIDQSIVSFSPYLMTPGTERARTGWEAPHIVLDRTAPWPLASTFETLFEESWRTATPLGPPGAGPANSLAGRYSGGCL
jgi:DNA-binding SARP family transcriptional activator